MIRVPKLEMHLAYGCNLRCEQCSHYSNYGLDGGSLSFPEGAAWLRNWSDRVEPVRFSFLGGEPLLNPGLPFFLLLARDLWRQTHIRLVTNGLLLPRCGEDFWRAISETNTLLTVSMHSRAEKYQRDFRAALDSINSYSQRFPFRYETRNSVDGWYRFYRGSGRDMLPFDDGNPGASWAVCASKHCVTLENNALWKCPPLAHFPRVARKFALHSKPEWRPAMSYEPLTLTATDDELREFFARREEPACALCPSKIDYFEKKIF